MKTHLIAVLIGVLIVSAGPAWAADGNASPASVADEFKAIRDFAKASPIAAKDATVQQVTEMRHRHQLELYGKLKTFYEAHPDDPTRWSAVLMMRKVNPTFIVSFGPDYAKNPKDVVVDKAAREKFKAEMARFNVELSRATDLPEDARAAVESPDLLKKLWEARRKDAVVDWQGLRSQVDAYIAKYPNVDDATSVVDLYMRSFLPGRTPAEARAEWGRFASSPSEAVAKKAAEEGVDSVKAAEPLRLASGQEWMTDWAAAKAFAAREGKRLFLDFTGSDWCDPCRKLEREIFTTPEFAAFAKGYVLVRLDFPAKAKLPLAERVQNATLNRDFKIDGFPTILIADATGKELRREEGFHPGTGVADYLKKFDASENQ